jgi:hypothetical protein
MQRALPFLIAAITVVAAPAVAADCQVETAAQILPALGKTPLEAGLVDAIGALREKPQYFDDPKQGASCARPKLDNPLYPGIPVTECTYQHLGLTGWVMLANPSAAVAAKWVSNACGETADAKTCAMSLTAQAWCASQFSFPVVGNLVTPVTTADGKTVGVNTPYLHGVAIPRPQWMPERVPIATDVQRQRLSPLAASENAYSGFAARGALPSGIASTVYAKYAAVSANGGKKSSFGDACPAFGRRGEWISASRASYTEAWRNGRNAMFDAAAKALMAGEPASGQTCP